VRAVNATLDRLVRSGGGAGVTTLPTPLPMAREPLVQDPHIEEPLPPDYEPMMIAGQPAPLVEGKVTAPPMPRLPTDGDELPSFPLGMAADDRSASAPVAPSVLDSSRPARSGLPTLPQLDAIPLEANLPPPKARPPVRPGQPPSTARAPVSPLAAPMPVGMGRAATLPPAPATKPTPAPPAHRSAAFGAPIEESDLASSSAIKRSSAAAGSDGIAPSLPPADRFGNKVAPPSEADFNDATAVSPPSDDLVEKSRNTRLHKTDDLEAYFRTIFQGFVELKRKCGEPTENVTYEKFVAKLRDNREQLIKKLGCKSVKFQVYVKDGKAALKASPVRD
jgi:hypothetical protein